MPQASLQAVVRALLNPGEKVDIVKIPLNSMPPETLKAELYVRGISDWSQSCAHARAHMSTHLPNGRSTPKALQPITNTQH